MDMIIEILFKPLDTCTQTIIPLVRKFCENAMNNEDSTLPAVAKQFGRLCHGLSGKGLLDYSSYQAFVPCVLFPPQLYENASLIWLQVMSRNTNVVSGLTAFAAAMVVWHRDEIIIKIKF